MTPSAKVAQLETELLAAEKRAVSARAEREAAALQAYGGESIVTNTGYKSASRSVVASELEVESLAVALAGAKAELARTEAAEQAQREREKAEAIRALCRAREAAAARAEIAMRDLARSLEEMETLADGISAAIGRPKGLRQWTSPIGPDAASFRLNLLCEFSGLARFGLGDPLNELGRHKYRPLADMEAEAHRRALQT